MSDTLTIPACEVISMPPLILHPFAEATDSGKLMESSRAGMALDGLLPKEGKNRFQLDRAVLEGRYCEIRMLFYVGRDVTRWIDQCLEVAARTPDDYPAGVCRQSFVEYLIEHAPSSVEEKLTRWGVHGYQRIFSRAFALNCIFAEPPAPTTVTENFVRHYHPYVDQIFAYELRKPFPSLDPSRYRFELYASGEYSRMLERQWEEA